MPDIAIDQTQVFTSEFARLGTGIAGEVITAGETLYFETVTNTLKLASNNSATEANFIGVARVGAASGQPVLFAYSDISFQSGGDVISGTTLYLSTTSGAMTTTEPSSGDYVTVVGVGITTDLTAFTFDSTLITFDSTIFTFDMANIYFMNLRAIQNGQKT